MKKKKAPKKNPSAKKPTSARLLRNRPVDAEPPEVEATEVEQTETSESEVVEEEQLETPDTPKQKPKRGRQARLPGTEDSAIEELEGLAEEYADARDRRMAIGEEEVKLKTELLDEMKKHNKTKYFHAGISIEVVNSKDKVKVRIKKDE